MREGYSRVESSTHFVCLCVSLTTLEAMLIYSAKNGHQWTANSILFIFKKLKFRKSAPLIHKQPSKLTALYRTSLASSPGSQKGEGEGKREPGIQRSRMR